MAKVNLRDKLSKFSEHWTPKVVAEINDYQFKLVKIEGEFVWHEHSHTDTAQRCARQRTVYDAKRVL